MSLNYHFITFTGHQTDILGKLYVNIESMKRFLQHLRESSLMIVNALAGPFFRIFFAFLARLLGITTHKSYIILPGSRTIVQ